MGAAPSIIPGMSLGKRVNGVSRCVLLRRVPCCTLRGLIDGISPGIGAVSAMSSSAMAAISCSKMKKALAFCRSICQLFRAQIAVQDHQMAVQ